jgi:hypothetical protein
LDLKDLTSAGREYEINATPDQLASRRFEPEESATVNFELQHIKCFLASGITACLGRML